MGIASLRRRCDGKTGADTENLRSLCAQFLHGQYRLTIIDEVKTGIGARTRNSGDSHVGRVAPRAEKTVIGACLTWSAC